MARKVRNQNPSIPLAILYGCIVSLVVTLCAAAITTFLVAGERIAMEQVGYASGAALFLGAFLGALVACGRAGQKRMVVCLAGGTAYLVSLLCVTAMFFDGQYAGVPVSALLILGASATAGLLGMKNGGVKRRKKLRF